MPGLPVVTGVHAVTNGVTVTWDGPPGYYQLFEKQLGRIQWEAVGKATNLILEATVSQPSQHASFASPARRQITPAIADLAPNAIRPSLTPWMHTPHAAAFTNAEFLANGGQTNASCLACHTVGFGLPTGFSSLAKTPQLAGRAMRKLPRPGRQSRRQSR
jgi:hypothetical protein